METRGVVVRLLATGAIVRGDDARVIFLPRSETIGHYPRVGDVFLYDVQEDARGPLAVGAVWRGVR